MAETQRCPNLPKRYLLVVMVSIGMCIIHAQRVNIAVTVVTILDKAPHTKVGTEQAANEVCMEINI